MIFKKFFEQFSGQSCGIIPNILNDKNVIFIHFHFSFIFFYFYNFKKLCLVINFFILLNLSGSLEICFVLDVLQVLFVGLRMYNIILYRVHISSSVVEDVLKTKSFIDSIILIFLHFSSNYMYMGLNA